MLFLLIFARWYLRLKRREDRRARYALAARRGENPFLPGSSSRDPAGSLLASMPRGVGLRDIIEQSSSGSGSGLPLLVSARAAIRWARALPKH